jgi:8-oxo-dGTP pyrophosphatase MutT (NUDIX family)
MDFHAYEWKSIAAPTPGYGRRVPRRTVKLLLVDPDDRLLLVRGRDSADGAHHWYPVGGGIEDGESHHEAAVREAWEETGIEGLPTGDTVWTREAHYEHAGLRYDVHETWLRYPVAHFIPTPARLSDLEQQGIIGFRWWTADELRATTASVFPPDLGERFARLLVEGCPTTPIDIG